MKTIWTKERCYEEAIKYMTKKEFREKSPSAYTKCLKNKWMVFSHMIEMKKPKEYWTKERCRKEALKFKSRSEFNKKSVSAYSKAWENNWLDDICKEMKTIGNKFKRCIYVYEFSDNFAYVGLTFNIETRCQQHFKRGPVYNHILSNNIIPIFKKLTEYINIEEAKNEESNYINIYKEKGFKLLNKQKAGACGGGVRKWTKERCCEEAIKYNNVKEYKNNSNSYRAAVRNKWLDDICQHMNRNKKPNNYWTKENCIKVSINIKSKIEFSNKFPGAYSACIKNKWLDEISNHMTNREIKPKGYWTKENCQKEAFKYTSKKELREKNISCYQIILKNKWMKEIELYYL